MLGLQVASSMCGAAVLLPAARQVAAAALLLHGARAAAPAGMPLALNPTRGVATHPISTPKSEILMSELCQMPAPPSQRTSTASVARRLAWQALPITAPRSLEAVIHDRDSPQARIVTEAVPPYRVVWANAAWEQLCGWRAEEVIGKHGLSCLKGDATDRAVLRRVATAALEGERIAVHLVSKKRDGSQFISLLQVAPLRSMLGDCTHVLGIMQEVPDAKCDLQPLPNHSQPQQEQQQQQQQAHQEHPPAN